MSKYHIGEWVFRTKGDIVSHVRGILERTPVGTSLAPDDFSFLLALLQRHPSADQKIGVGVWSIRVDLNTHWKPFKAFTLVRRDGSETDFSYRSCIFLPRPDARFHEACRHAVIGDVLEFKRRVFDRQANECNQVRCAVTGALVGWDETHVDHAPPWTFKAIVDAFIDAERLDVAAVPLTGDGDNEYQHRFVDDAFTERFRNFHNARARLRIVTWRANLERCP